MDTAPPIPAVAAPEPDASRAPARRPRFPAALAWIPAGVVIVDQVAKAIVRARLPLHESRTVIDGLLDLTHVQNSGAAFGILNSADFAYKPLVLAAVAALALVGIVFYASQLPASQRVARAGLAFIVGGAAGNLIDRITVGYVLDFIDAYWGGWHFWAFNVADAAITAGVVLMIADLAGLTSHVSATS